MGKERSDIERDILFVAEFVSAAVTLYFMWQLVKNDASFTELRMRYFRALSRGSKKVAEKASVIAANADTAYWSVAQR
jgi:hypothetical protein